MIIIWCNTIIITYPKVTKHINKKGVDAAIGINPVSGYFDTLYLFNDNLFRCLASTSLYIENIYPSR